MLRAILSGFMLWFLLAGLVTQAQEYGLVEEYEWRLSPPEEYRSLGAAVIFDIAQATTELRGLELKRHVRSILLDESGLELIGSAMIECYEYDYLTKVRAQILSPSGRVVELSKKDITRHSLGLKEITTITFPDLQAGDIIEYSYQLDYYGGYDKLGVEKYFLFSQEKGYQAYMLREDFGGISWDSHDLKQVSNLPTWFFDHPVYTFSSAFSAKIGGDIDYLYFTTNLPDSVSEPQTETIYIISAPVYKLHSWKMEEIAPFMPDIDQMLEAEAQRKAVHFRLFSSSGRNRIMSGGYTDQHWQYVGQSFQGYVLEYAKTSKSLRKKVRSLAAGKKSDRAKLEAFHDFIAAEFTVDSSGYDLRPLNNTLKQLYKNKRAKPFELNLLLVKMLKMAGVKAAPIAISTRDKLSFRKSGRFNHMITRVEIDGEDILVDASSTECPLGMLPQASIVTEGVGIDFDDSKPCLIIPIGCDPR